MPRGCIRKDVEGPLCEAHSGLVHGRGQEGYPVVAVAGQRRTPLPSYEEGERRASADARSGSGQGDLRERQLGDEGSGERAWTVGDVGLHRQEV